MTEPNDPFDELLRAAMGRRPETMPSQDLAARAMQIAQARSARIAPSRLRRLRLIVRLVSVAAVVLIGMIVSIGVHRLADHGDLTLTPGNSYTDSSASATGSSTATSLTSSDDSSTWNWIIMIGVVGLTGLGAMAVIRQSSPFAGAAGMARFA